MNLPMKEKKWNVIFNKTFHEILIQASSSLWVMPSFFYYPLKYIETDLWMLLEAKIFLQNN